MTYSHQDKHDFIQGEIWAKQQWLKTQTGPKSVWPQHIIDQKQDALRKLEAIADDYKRAIERKSA
jgi:hypothetical protein